MASKEKDLADLAQNARRQREIAQEALEELRKVDKLLNEPDLDAKTKAALAYQGRFLGGKETLASDQCHRRGELVRVSDGS